MSHSRWTSSNQSVNQFDAELSNHISPSDQRSKIIKVHENVLSGRSCWCKNDHYSKLMARIYTAFRVTTTKLFLNFGGGSATSMNRHELVPCHVRRRSLAPIALYEPKLQFSISIASYGTHLWWRQLHTYYLPRHHSSTDCGTDGTLLLALGLDRFASLASGLMISSGRWDRSPSKRERRELFRRRLAGEVGIALDVWARLCRCERDPELPTSEKRELWPVGVVVSVSLRWCYHF